jgi:hypothetical protein
MESLGCRWSAGRSALAARSGELAGRTILDILRRFLQQESSKSKRLDRDPLVVLQLGCKIH